jgi:hypothetical protein
MYISPKRLQEIVDDVIFQGHEVIKPKRKYDNTKFGDVFEGQGKEVFNRLISTARQYFIRHIDIPDKQFPMLIDHAVNGICDRNADEYDTLYKRLREWRKNWSRNYIKVSQEVLVELRSKNPDWTGSTKNQLRSLYQAQFSYEYLYHMMSGVHAGTIDWRESLKHVGLNSLYRTIFTWTMV